MYKLSEYIKYYIYYNKLFKNLIKNNILKIEIDIIDEEYKLIFSIYHSALYSFILFYPYKYDIKIIFRCL